MRKSLFLLIALTVVFIAGFQNCGTSEHQRSINKSYTLNSGGNGESYGGKITLVNLTEFAPCQNGDNRRSILEKTDAGMFLTRKDCQDMNPPMAVTTQATDFMEHNAEQATFNGHLFNIASKPTQKMLCRYMALSTTYDYEDYTFINDTASFSTLRSRGGSYDVVNNKMLDHWDSGDFSVTRSFRNDGSVVKVRYATLTRKTRVFAIELDLVPDGYGQMISGDMIVIANGTETRQAGAFKCYVR